MCTFKEGICPKEGYKRRGKRQDAGISRCMVPRTPGIPMGIADHRRTSTSAISKLKPTRRPVIRTTPRTSHQNLVSSGGSSRNVRNMTILDVRLENWGSAVVSKIGHAQSRNGLTPFPMNTSAR